MRPSCHFQAARRVAHANCRDGVRLIARGTISELMQKPLSEGGSSVYLRLSTRPLEQPERTMTSELQQGIINVRAGMT